MKAIWTPISKNNSPKGECLAFGFDNQVLIGTISYDEENDEFVCQGEGMPLLNVTHFVTIENLIKSVYKE